MAENINFLKSVKNFFANIPSIFVFLWLLFILTDIVEVIKFGFKIEDIRYIFPFSSLLYASSLFVGFLLILSNLANKNLLNASIIFILATAFLFVFDVKVYSKDDFVENILSLAAITLFALLIFTKSKQLYDFFKDIKSIVLLSAMLISFFVFIVAYTPNTFLSIYKNHEGKMDFLQTPNSLIRLFYPKFFTPNMLEKSYDCIKFKHSKIALDELQDIIHDRCLPYYGFEDKIWAWYLRNGSYRTFFVVNGENLNYKLTLIISEVLDNDSFKIIKFLKKDISLRET